MARSFLTPINLNKLELQNARIQNLATAPSSPVVGQIYYDTSLNGLYIYNGTAWALAGGISAGTLSSRPLANAVAAGTFYYATDNFLIYYSNGSTWQQVDNFGSGQSTSISITASSADGTSTNFARADHTHAGPGFGTVVTGTSYGQTSTSGSASTVARSDHSHGTPSLGALTPTAITSTTGAAGSASTASASDHSHGFTPADFTLDTFGAPVANVSLNTYKITNLGTPTSATDAATKGYVDSVAEGLYVLGSVRTATSTSLTLSATLTSLSGVALNNGDRILVKNQATATQNGIYTYNSSTQLLVASTNLEDTSLKEGTFVFVEEGTYATQGWIITAYSAGASTWTQFSAAGEYTAGNGITISGASIAFNPISTGGLQASGTGASILLPSTSGLTTTSSGLSINPTSTGGLTTSSSGILIKLATTSGLVTDSTGLYVGAGTGIVVNTNNVAIDTTLVVRKYATTIGNNSATSFTVTHNLGTQDVIVAIYDTATYVEYEADITHSTTNTITVAFATAPTTNQIRVVVHA